MSEPLEHPGNPSSAEAPPAVSASPGWFALQLPQCVIVYDAAGRALVANDPLLRWLGREEADVIGRTLFELWPGDLASREAADFHLVLEGGRIEQVETRSGADGARAVRAVKFPWRGASGSVEGMVVVFDELPASPAGSLAQPEAIGRLALGIVHDFNNALTLLRGQLSLVEETLPGFAGARGALEGMRQVLEHACQLPRQLLSFIRNEPLARQRIDLNALLSSLEVLLRPRLAGTTLEFRLDRGGAWVEGDSVQLTQALLNLAGNALDAMPGGGRLVVETRQVIVHSGQDTLAEDPRSGTFVRVTLFDSGPGIAPDVLPRIFEPLYTTRPSGQGSGLGLAIVNEIVHRHGGWITCQSSLGQGTRFVLHLPALSLEPAKTSARPGRIARVLVLERDPDIRQLTAMILEQGPFHAEPAGSLQRARELASACHGQVDLILISSDLCVGASGAALSELLAEVPKAGLLVTTSGQQPMLPPESRYAFRGVVPKPYSADLLMRAVQAALWGGATGASPRA
jgi:two-component system cell cycle sensor histidine kinase/response regulator CckA